MNIAQAIWYAYPHATNGPDGHDFHVRDDGEGPYIETWNLPGDVPSEAQLWAWWKAAQPGLALADVRAARAAEYPPLADQLDALWKMLAANGGLAADNPAKAMLEQVLAVKARHPKPQA